MQVFSEKLGTCSGNKSAHLNLHFVVNMGFYQLLCTNRPNLVANVKPTIHKWPKTFQVRLFRASSKPLDKPTHLLEIIGHMDGRGWKEL